MTLETAFTTANLLALAGWLALLAAPRRRIIHWHLAGLGLPVLLSLAYAVTLATQAPGAEGSFRSLAGVGALFRSEGVLLAGWIHYLAFDLFIGAWMCRRATAERMNPWLVRLCLPPTFLFGPLGLLAFLGLRAGFAKGSPG
jgi:hypothetical protein